MKTCSIFVALLMALSGSALSPDPAKTSKIDVVVYDIGADRPVAHASVEVIVYSDCASGTEILRSSVLTGEHGEFQISLPIGDHLLLVTAPLGAPVRACVTIASAKEIESCGGKKAPSAMQRLFVRTVSSSRKFPSDILISHPCAASNHSVCDPLSLPNTISSRHVVFVDDENRPIANLTLDFRKYSKVVGESFGSVTTDSEGVADLSPIYDHPNAAGSLVQAGFLLKLSRAPTDQLQRIKVVRWQCGGKEQWQATSE